MPVYLGVYGAHYSLRLPCRYTVLVETRPLQFSCFSFESPVPIDDFVKEFPPRSWRGEFRHTLDWIVALALHNI